MQATSIALVGAPYTGKTELATALCESLSNCFRLPEYARVYIDRFGPPKHPAEQMLMLRTNLEAEESLGRLFSYNIIDSPTFVYAIYGMELTTRSSANKYAAFYREFKQSAVRYANLADLTVFLSCADIPYTEDNMDDIRQLTPYERLAMDKMLNEHLVQHVEDYVKPRGTVEQRKDFVLDQLRTRGLLND